MAEVPNQTTAIQEAIRHWPKLKDLFTFAIERHGFGDTNGGFGVTYPDDLDEYAREVEMRRIPVGFVLLYGFWGSPDGYELLVPERAYLEELARALDKGGFKAESTELRSARQLTGE